MSIPIVSVIDFNNIPHKNFAVEKLGALPVPGNPGRMITLVANDSLYFDDGIRWRLVQDGFTPLPAHTHTTAEIINLDTILENKAALVHRHDNATNGQDGYMSAADKGKLDGIAANSNNYSHPTGDGNLHVPATSTTNNGKVLKAGATAGSLAWGTLVKTDVGLSNVDNTSDANKPVSTAQQTALNLKSDSTHVHANATTSVHGFMSSTDKSKLDGVATGANNYTHPSGDGNLHVPANGTTNNGRVLTASATSGSISWVALTKAAVGLGNVDNTSDANKPLSSAAQSALALKSDVGHTHVAANITDFDTAVANRIIAYFAGTAGSDGQYDTLREIIDRLLEEDLNPGARHFEAFIGNGSATQFDVTHNFASRDVIVNVYDSTTYESVLVDIIRLTTNVVRVKFGLAPASNAYRVVIIAGG